MSIRNLLFCSCVIVASVASPAFARIDFDVDINTAPPAPQVEVVQAARPGFLWIPGYWAWEDGRHVWVEGRWIQERPGYMWVPEHWEQRGSKWHFERGYWERREHEEHHEQEHEHH